MPLEAVATAARDATLAGLCASVDVNVDVDLNAVVNVDVLDANVVICSICQCC